MRRREEENILKYATAFFRPEGMNSFELNNNMANLRTYRATPDACLKEPFWKS